MAMKDRNQAFRHSNIFHTIITKSSKVEIQTLYIYKFISGVINMTASPWWFFFRKICSKGKIMKTNLFVDKFIMLGKKGWIANTYRADSRIAHTNERQHYFVTMSPIGWAQTKNQLWLVENTYRISYIISHPYTDRYDFIQCWIFMSLIAFLKYPAGPWYIILQWTQIFISNDWLYHYWIFLSTEFPISHFVLTCQKSSKYIQ